MKWLPSDCDAYPVVEISEDGEYFLAKAGPTLFGGWRLKSGLVIEIYLGNYLEICCGPKEEDYQWMLEQVKKIVDLNLEEDPHDDPFRGIPMMSRIKPYPHCEWFLSQIKNLTEPREKKHHPVKR
jgi:hypothetical protein